MSFQISRVDIWAGEVHDRRGTLADMLEAVTGAGADLDFIIVRPSPVKSGTGILYVAPLFGPEQEKAAEGVGLAKSSHIEALRVDGPDRPGLGAAIARKLAEAGLNISGFTGGRMGARCVIYIRFESERELSTATEVLRDALSS